MIIFVIYALVCPGMITSIVIMTYGIDLVSKYQFSWYLYMGTVELM